MPFLESSPCQIGINGFGRIGMVDGLFSRLPRLTPIIGRNVLRASLLRQDVQIAAINHTCNSIADVIALLMHDSTHGPLSRLVTGLLSVCALPNGNLSVNGHEIRLLSERDATKIPWAVLGVEYVAECTGKFRSSALASAHVTFGRAKKVLISAPCADAPTFVYKVNTSEYNRHKQTSVYSCASCTTNCLAPILKVLDSAFGVDQALMTTVHASTQSQHVLDGYSKKDRRAGRSIMGNIIPNFNRSSGRHYCRLARPAGSSQRHLGARARHKCVDGRPHRRHLESDFAS